MKVEETPEFVEVKDADSYNEDPTKRRVEINVYWRWEDTKIFDVPVDMSLDEVRENILGFHPNTHDENFDQANADFMEFECWNINDLDTDEEWWI